jgi:hypothetical protein
LTTNINWTPFSPVEVRRGSDTQFREITGVSKRISKRIDMIENRISKEKELKSRQLDCRPEQNSELQVTCSFANF